jgi:hypothetical protein
MIKKLMREFIEIADIIHKPLFFAVVAAFLALSIILY